MTISDRSFKKRLEILLLIIGVGGIVQLGFRQISFPDPYQPAIAAKVIRFHVRANSDSKEDQALKEKVRDAIGTMMEERLQDTEVASVTQSREVIRTSLPDIVTTAEDTLRLNGSTDTVKAKLETVSFPEKEYGKFRFPAGKYEALLVEIGEGKGQNWWCVLYPNLCFRDSVYQVVEEETEKTLKMTLSAEEYKDIFEQGNYEIRWKILDYFK